MPVLQARVSDETKAAWQALALRSGLGASELLRQAITSILANNPASETAPEAPSPTAAPADDDEEDAVEGEGGRIRLPFREHELAAIGEAAAALGWRRNTWIVSVVRNALFNEPRPTTDELTALQRSTSEFLAVGRNLNQIARAMHRDDRYKASVTVERLDVLREKIATHTDDVSALLDAIERRWRPPESFRPETSETV